MSLFTAASYVYCFAHSAILQLVPETRLESLPLCLVKSATESETQKLHDSRQSSNQRLLQSLLDKLRSIEVWSLLVSIYLYLYLQIYLFVCLYAYLPSPGCIDGLYRSVYFSTPPSFFCEWRFIHDLAAVCSLTSPITEAPRSTVHSEKRLLSCETIRNWLRTLVRP